MQVKTRLIAFYLPQFHPIPENDAWWGKGFTEWTNVVQAKPLFPGHYQPHLPADLGFYDLRLLEARQAQADLASEYGIFGFCYYHYWFQGKRLLERPFDEVVASGKPVFPFCLCWANESWKKVRNGRTSEWLIKQEYSEEDNRQHIRWLVNAFNDQRYIRVNGKPLFLVYRASQLPDPRRTTDLWRCEAKKMGIGDLYLCRVESFTDERSDPGELGFDASVEFQPDWAALGVPKRRGRFWAIFTKLGVSSPGYQSNRVFEYSTMVERALHKSSPPHKRFPCVTPSWDNSPRYQSASVIFQRSSPTLFEKWLSEIVRRTLNKDPDENLIFLNAWNEWGEGNHLEPDLRFGRSYLEATKRALDACNSVPEHFAANSKEYSIASQQ